MIYDVYSGLSFIEFALLKVLILIFLTDDDKAKICNCISVIKDIWLFKNLNCNITYILHFM